MSDESTRKRPEELAYRELLNNLEEVNRRCCELFAESGRMEPGGNLPPADPFNLAETMMKLGLAMLADPARLLEGQAELMQDYARLWQELAARWGERPEASESPPEEARAKPQDKRFKHQAWEENPLFDHLRQAYLMTAEFIEKKVAESSLGLDRKEAQKARFFTRQYIDALSPSNFLLTNPEALQETLESRGENLFRGLKNVLEDFRAGRIRQTDTEAFEIGVNIATTPGRVVFRNRLMELIQYEPTTATVFRRPLLIIPPWINKFYILDLEPRNSFIAWAVSRGYTVFVISWVNPGAEMADTGFADYMREGIFAALEAIEQATGEREVTALGYCIGGTLLACALAYMAAREDERIKAATMLVAQVDFSEPGELGVFIDKAQLEALERRMDEKGYLDGAEMATAFNLLRANDLIWSYVVGNYLMGRDPYPFNLLYWNQDSTRMPRAMHSFYLREMYLHNRLVEPGAIVLDGVPLDLGRIRVPIYLQSAREDHISPCASVFKGRHFFAGPVRFIVAGSGHIAGVINPPAAGKYYYLTNEREPDDFTAWMAGARKHPGSWWVDWHRWLYRRSGRKVAARVPGAGGLPALEEAPGSYVKGK